jgi:hypothetical protein
VRRYRTRLLAGGFDLAFFRRHRTRPPRQAGIAGQATFTVQVTPEGKIAVSEASAANPLLVEEGKRCIETWSFTGVTRERKVSVTIYFGFTGTPVETNPKSTVTADFSDSSIVVYVTTNPAPMVRP